MTHEYNSRAILSVCDSFQRGMFSAFSFCHVDEWPHGDAREIGQYARICATTDDDPYQCWHDFPGGWPRFLDMWNRATVDAMREAHGSHVVWIPLAQADEILTEEGHG